MAFDAGVEGTPMMPLFCLFRVVVKDAEFCQRKWAEGHAGLKVTRNLGKLCLCKPCAFLITSLALDSNMMSKA
jgi:hypothetical protein